MEITEKAREGCQRTFTVTMEWERVAPHYEGVVKAVRGQARLPGFRPGKAPAALVKARFAAEIREEVLERILPEAAQETLKQFSLDPVVEPRAAETHLEEGQPFTCELKVEVAPEFPEVTASGLEISSPKPEVKEEQVEKVLASLRERAAVMKPVEEAAEGDYLVLSQKRAGQEKEQEVFHRALPQSDHPVERVLAGKKAGETFQLEVEPPATEEERKKAPLAPGRYTFTVTKVVRREVPPLSDDFAKDLGAESLEALRARIREDLTAQVQREVKGFQENRLLESLLEKYPVPLPPTLVERQLREDLAELAEEWEREGMGAMVQKVDWKEIADSRRPIAQRKVGAYFLLRQMADRKGLAATEEDVDAYFTELAAGSRLTPETLKARFAKEERLDEVRDLIARKKALDLLLREASVRLVEGKPSPEEEG
ncbi:MAG: trigger factor [Acidobacteriota bacterium]